MSKNVNVKFLLQRVIAAALFVLALWIFYSKFVGDEQSIESADNFRNPSIARTTPIPVSTFFFENYKACHNYLKFIFIFTSK